MTGRVFWRPRCAAKTHHTASSTSRFRLLARAWPRRGLVVGLIVIGVALIAAQVAYASWSWQGEVGIGEGNGACHWYPGQGACSPSTSSWNYINGENALGGTVLVGFENTNAIRGSYLTQNQNVRVYLSSLSLSNPTQGQVTFCTWSTSCYSIYGQAAISMTVY